MYIHRLASTQGKQIDLLHRNNNFAFAGEITSSLRCPFAAHVRKTNPRDDLEVPPSPIKPISVQPRRIMRRGIQFGPEMSEAEKESGKTMHSRGLLFNCYQSSIENGFQFLQKCKRDFKKILSSLILIGTHKHGRTIRNSLLSLARHRLQGA